MATFMCCFNRLQNITKVLRYAELCAVSIFLLWISAHVPFAVKISGEYFRRVVRVVVSPLFVFLLGNAIVVALVVKSRRPGDDAEPELYEELTKHNPKPEEPETEIVYEDKEIICEGDTERTHADTDTDSDTESEYCPRAIRRTKSAKLAKSSEEVSPKRLRRSETERCRKSVITDDVPGEEVLSEDEMSNEEFQRAIEEFIAKQLKFRREEAMAVVLQNQG